MILLAGAFLYGTCFSIGSLGISMMTRTLYGDAQYGSAYSIITLVTSIASAIGVTLIGAGRSHFYIPEAGKAFETG